MRRRSVIGFNLVSVSLQPREVEKLRKLYCYYHRLATCYKWKYKGLRALGVALNVMSIGLIVVGGVTGGVTANPIVLGAIEGPGILIQTYIMKSDLARKVECCRFAYTSYQKVLVQIRAFLRGVAFDEAMFLSDVKVLDDIVIDMCPLCDGMVKRYRSRYEADHWNPNI